MLLWWKPWILSNGSIRLQLLCTKAMELCKLKKNSETVVKVFFAPIIFRLAIF